MTREEEQIQSLPPRYQHRMAELALSGWNFRLRTVREWLEHSAVADLIEDDRKVVDAYVDTKRWSAQHDDYYSQHAATLELLLDGIEVAIQRDAWRKDSKKLLEASDSGSRWLQEMKHKTDRYW